jgi:VanZ family protein
VIQRGSALAAHLGRSRLARSVPALIWMAVIFYLSSQPVLPIDGQPHSDLYHRFGHVGAYGVLALLVRYAVAGLPSPGWLALGITIAYGVSDEVHQTFVPSRSGTIRDVLIDGASAGAALGALWFWQRTQRRPVVGSHRARDQKPPRRAP